MKRFDRIKTLQLVLLIIMTVTALTAILRNEELFGLIATNSAAKLIGVILWLTLGISFLFLLYDFNSYADMRRENMELDEAVHQDALTGVANRYSVDAYIGQFIGKAFPRDMGAVTLEIINLGEINREHGHSGGDLAIQAFSGILTEAASGGCFIGRNGGNKFVALFRDCTDAKLTRFTEAVAAGVEARNREYPDHVIKYSVGSATGAEEEVTNITELVALSDRRAWENSGRVW